MKTEVGVAAALLVAFSLTFGHAYHSDGVKYFYHAGTKMQAGSGARAYGAVLCALFFPFYWSVHLMEQPK